MTEKVVAFFDIDNTLVKGSSVVLFMRSLLGEGFFSKKALAYQLYHGLSFKFRGENMNFLDKMKQGLPLSKPIQVEWLQEFLSEIYEYRIQPRLKNKVVETLKDHQQQGHDVWLITAAPQIVADTFAEKLGATGAVGTQGEIVDGNFTGVVAGKLMHAKNKSSCAQKIAETSGYNLDSSYAYSDSVNDIPLLKTVGNPVAVDPDKDLFQYAQHLGWPILKSK
ncbi:MAG: HAD family hydrolase [Micrococcaceae bacterium]